MSTKISQQARDAATWLSAHSFARESGCLEWRGYCTKKGYGEIRIRGRKYLAHRISYQKFKGPIGDGKIIMHSCDNPRCINPAHLSSGTHNDNVQDCIAKGRNSAPPVFSGELNHASKITRQQADEIHSLLIMGTTQEQIAALYGISQSQVSQIKLRRNWPYAYAPIAEPTATAADREGTKNE